MTSWAWYWREADAESYGAEGETREAVIAAAVGGLQPGAAFHIIEARISAPAEHEGSAFIPFVERRHVENLIVGPDGVSALPQPEGA